MENDIYDRRVRTWSMLLGLDSSEIMDISIEQTSKYETSVVVAFKSCMVKEYLIDTFNIVIKEEHYV